MPVSSSVSPDGKEVTVHVSGRFDFAAQNEFRDAYHGVRAEDGVRFVVDLSRASYMDSSALGMLLMMREYLGGDSADITLSHCSEEITNILNVANFQSLFKIA